MKTSCLAGLVAGLLATSAQADPAAFVKAQGRGVNLGNMLEAPSEGAWGVTLKKQDLELIASRGFRNVRLPIRWDGLGVGSARFERMSRSEPYTIDPRFFERVDSALSWARQNRLLVTMNDHHHQPLFDSLATQTPRFLAMWKQIAERYKDLPDSVAFEILNEPNTQLTVETWNTLLDTTIRIIRQSNPTRPVVIGTANWGGLSGLSGLKLPADPNLILTIHYYEPFAFTHQGADWTTPVPPVGVKWTGTYYEKLAVKQAMDAIADFQKSHGNIPVFIGEFGAYSKADSASRGRWAGYCARLFESYGFSWAWWEFKAGFGIYNESGAKWNTYLTGPLLSDDTTVLELGNPAEGGTDLARNGGFASKTGWVLNGYQGASTLSVDSGNAAVKITKASADAWGIQLLQSPVLLKEGLTYVLQFDAWASSPRAIDGGLGMSVDPWTTYVSTSAGLTSVPKTFFVSFTAASTDSTARIGFNLGPDTGTVHLDNVKLLVWDTASTSGIASPARASRASVRWDRGALLGAGALPPAYAWVASLDGRRVAPLRWTRSGHGWSARVPGLKPGTWLLEGKGQSERIVVAR